jgi:hypothetical protein
MLNKSAIFTLCLGMTFMACGPLSHEDNLYPHTGSENLELAISAALDSRADVVEGEKYFISINGLRFRSTDNSGTNSNILGTLFRNDKIKVIKNNDSFSGNYIKVEILSSRSREFSNGTVGYVSLKYLLENKIDHQDFDGTYFMVQNIATERLRVYERLCSDNSCAHKMVLQTEVAMGEDTEGERTMVGSYRITDWRKFYEDGKSNYPSWYDPNYPPVPSPDDGIQSWFKDKHLPPGDNSSRGAFGWWAALVGPNHKGQWTHGTYGWGVNKKKYITRTKKFFANVISDTRSHGCTRADNESIAYLRQILPVGTPIIKVYAKEKLLDPQRKGYSKEMPEWEYILTKRGVRRDGQKADKAEVLASDITNDEILEEGSYAINQWPEIVEYRDYSLFSFLRKVGDKGNLYNVDPEDMQGTFYIDAGLLENYKHPNDLAVGGYRGEVTPEFMDIRKILN